jgi:hypothetical protein
LIKGQIDLLDCLLEPEAEALGQARIVKRSGTRGDQDLMGLARRKVSRAIV